jgi:hypothetical protein
MSQFTVVWASDAENRLAGIWTSATDRSAIAVAADSIDRELGSNNPAFGQPVSEGLFRLVRPPLSALFAIDEADRLVRILYVRLI